ncbi:DUF1800 family protein [Verrucomicrobium spinosum]|uniref:DUF1800 family protein n=1 Tax=Verrucomicrobium spinosum TaxID=2736 RepID=UPI0012F66CB3|nr:DUF1800 family protein [Verrucomicrobium spinosum]
MRSPASLVSPSRFAESRPAWALSLLLALLPGTAALAELDKNTNQLSDVWELQFNAQALTAGLDTDHDGFTNLQEAAGGTNPFDATSRPAIGIGAGPGNGAEISWQSSPGKRYRIDVSNTLALNSWQTLLTVDGTGEIFDLPISVAPGSQFFRLNVSDIDTDLDGLSDWEERQLGLDPRSSASERQATSDFSRVNTEWTGTSVVTVGLLDGEINEDWPDKGLVAIRRTGGLKPITVNLTLTGTATRDADYTCPVIGSQVTIPLGVREVWVEFTPLEDSQTEGAETIILTATSGTGYTLGTTTTATVTLADASTQPSPKAAARFLIQAAFGPDSDGADADAVPENVEEVMALGFEGWIDQQFAMTPVGKLQPYVDWAVPNGQALALYGNYKEFAWWGRVMGSPKLSPTAPASPAQPYDALRQRVAFALSEILVTSDRPEQLAVEQQGMANYYDLMVQHAFGNYQDLLYAVATHPVMGIYLSHLGNQKANSALRIYPDENFAREVMQLFSIGLWELNPDGTRKLVNDNPVPTYNNGDITELARVFTGLSFGNNANFQLYPRDFTVPMKMWDQYHDCEAKVLLGGMQLPARTPSSGNAGTAGLADVTAAIQNLFNHPNVGPFIGRQLIQRLVTSNPSPGYVGRVSAAFADNGSGVRGDLKAVVKAILLDPEARDPAVMDLPTWGRLREPLLRVVNMARAFNAASTSGHYPLDQFSTDHMQDPMNAPSVFNFFLPNHSPPGPITQEGLVAPEFQIINASTAITGPNYFWNAIEGSLHRYGNGTAAYIVKLQNDPELGMIVPSNLINQDTPSGAAAMDPDPLLRRLDLALTGGTLSARQFQIIREAMMRIPTSSWQWHRQRLRLATYLIVTSSDFNVQR